MTAVPPGAAAPHPPALRAQVAALQAKLAAENGLPGHEVMVTAGAAARQAVRMHEAALRAGATRAAGLGRPRSCWVVLQRLGAGPWTGCAVRSGRLPGAAHERRALLAL